MRAPAMPVAAEYALAVALERRSREIVASISLLQPTGNE